MTSFRVARPVALAMILFAAATAASAQDANLCDVAGEAPDVIVGDLHQLNSYGNIGNIYAYSVGTTSCNVGTCWLNWNSQTNDHPVIGQSMYRLSNGRIMQIGQSWLKHGFFALSEQLCSGDCVGTAGGHLGVNCSDPYSAGLNGQQSNLGPKFEINASTGEYPFPFSFDGQTGNTIYKRLQVHRNDLDLDLHPGAVYFVEGQYVTRDDAMAGNDDNNASYRSVGVRQNNFSLVLGPATVREKSAVQAWKANDPAVEETFVDVPNDGRFIVAAKATDNGDGTWHYEYAVHNLNSHRSGKSFSVAVPAGSTVTNIGFHDVPYHSGEPYDGTDWVGARDAFSDVVSWSTEPFEANEDANALRWATLYNFWFDVDAPPTMADATIALFRPGGGGDPDEVTAFTVGVDPCNNDGVCDFPNEDCGNCANDCVIGAACCGDAFCDAVEDSCVCAADCGAPPAKEFACADAFDDDCDGDVDCADLDCCTDGGCVTGVDNDQDLVADCDCDDNDASIWTAPSEVTGLTLFEDPGLGTTLNWTVPLEQGGQNLAYDTLRSDSANGWQVASVCITDGDQTDTTSVDVALPASGSVFHYLVRGTNTCPEGDGSVGRDSNDDERAAGSCP